MNSELIEKSISRIKQFEPPEGYYLAFSGGKDSEVLYDLTFRSNVKFEAHFHISTVDPPPLMKFIKNNFPDVIWDKPEMTMFQLILKKKYPPMRNSRYCCEHFREHYGKSRLILTGIRWEESRNRKKRQMNEICLRDKSRYFLHPLIDWKTSDIWKYIRANHMQYCELYDQGFTRIGCILCPMTQRKIKLREKIFFPKVYNRYLKTFDKIKDFFKPPFTSPEALFNWWIEDPTNLNQISMFKEV